MFHSKKVIFSFHGRTFGTVSTQTRATALVKPTDAFDKKREERHQ
jgi:acetylornithine/succinyldiaminopimelate/putrescine aminotransferase